MSDYSILHVQGLTKSYSSGNGTLTVLRDVTFSLAAGSTCAVVGPSGSGKTTLLGLCAGLDQPSAGTVMLDGTNLGTLNEDGRARLRNELIGFVCQSFQLLPTPTAMENVMVPMDLRGGNRSRKKAIALLETVGLGERLSHFPAQLSGGEQQRVALARAFINEPKILFADEPTGNLDSETSRSVIEIMLELNAKFGTALVLVTHDPDVAQLTEQTIRLRNGKMNNDP